MCIAYLLNIQNDLSRTGMIGDAGCREEEEEPGMVWMGYAIVNPC